MSRPENKRAGGAFPLDLTWAKMLWSLFEPFEVKHGKRALLLDPFANTGQAALLGAEMLALSPYLIELQDQFIEEGRRNLAKFYQDRDQPDYSLTRYLHDDSFKVEMSHGGFSLLYLNSPFDDMLVSADQHNVVESGDSPYGVRRSRVELEALKHFFKYLAPDGVLVWLAYQQHMSRKVIQVFQENSDMIRVFRFPELHLGEYNQIAVIARYIKGHEKVKDPQKLLEIENWWLDLRAHPEKIPPLDKVVDKLPQLIERGLFTKYTIPPLKIMRNTIYFEPRKFDSAAMLELNKRHGAHHLKAFAELTQPTVEPPLEQPLHKPNKRQMAVNIVSGMLDGIELRRNGKRALLRGSVRELYQKVSEEEEIVQNKDETLKRIRETTMIRPDHHICLLYEDGEIEDVSGADALQSLIAENSEMLIATFKERYQPFYDLFVHPVWAKLLKQLKPGGKGNFFKPQVYIVCCTIEHLAVKGKQITNAQMGTGKTPISGAVMIALRLLDLAVRYKDGDPLPALAQRFGISGLELKELVASLCERYGVKVGDLKTIPVDQPIIVGVPAVAPKVWLEQELPPLYSEFKLAQLFNASDAGRFMNEAAANRADDAIFVGVVSYENAKLNEGREPVAVPRYFRYFSWERDDYGRDHRVVKVVKKPSDPITGEIILDAKGEEVPWKRFTKEGRGKELLSFEGRALYGHAVEVVTLDDGKKELRVDHAKKRETRIVHRRLTNDERELNTASGYPVIASRQYPLYSEVRTFGLPKVGNGRAVTPMIEKHYPGKVITQLKTHRDGMKCTPYLAEVRVKPYTLLVHDWEHQTNLIPEEPILDPWLASKGVRCTEASGKKVAIERLMRKRKREEYRVGSGIPELDAALKKEGLDHYRLNVGEVTVRNPRYPVAAYLRRFWSGKIALFFADELHVLKATTSDAGQSWRDLALAANMVNGLTGTLYGGKSSSVYALAYVFDEEVRRLYPWSRSTPLKWIEDMGVRRMVETRDVGGSGNSIRSGGKKSNIVITEAAGAAPRLMRVLAKYTLWASLLDLGSKMPSKEEKSYEVEMSPEQADLDSAIYNELRRYNGERLMQNDRSFLAAFYTNNLYSTDAMHRPWQVNHNVTTDKGAARKKYAGVVSVPVMYIPSLGDTLRPKEEQALEWLRRDLADGRRVIIALCQTSGRDIRDRWLEIIAAHVPKAKVFKLNETVPPADRATHIRAKTADGFNVMITNGGLITTAISLTQFSAWYSIEYDQSLYKFSQACARINRPNSERRDIVYRHFYYKQKFQKQSVVNIADKTRAAAVLAGAEGGDLSAMMGSEDRVPSYEMLLKAIENGQVKEKSAEEISAAFAAATFNHDSYESSAWYVEGDELEDADSAEFYGETEFLEGEARIDSEPEVEDEEVLVNE